MSALDLPAGDAWFWLGGSLLLAVLWTNLSWLFAPWAEPGRSPDDSESLAESIVVRLSNWRFAPLFFQALRLLYYVGLPFAALFWGYDAIISRFFGLQRLVLPTPSALEEGAPIDANWIDWGCDIGWAGALAIGTWGVLWVAGRVRRRAVAGGAGLDNRATGWDNLREAIFHETHWAFYRNVPTVVLGLYWGTWTGLLLVAFEALANPVWRKGIVTAERSAAYLLRATLAVVSTLLFLRTQNLWLAILLHWGVSSGLRGLYSGCSGPPSEGARMGP